MIKNTMDKNGSATFSAIIVLTKLSGDVGAEVVSDG
jgi:hypothetical protein